MGYALWLYTWVTHASMHVPELDGEIHCTPSLAHFPCAPPCTPCTRCTPHTPSRLPLIIQVFSKLEGEILLLNLLKAESAQVRRVAAAALFAACTASAHICARVAASGGTISLAEVALGRREAVAVRACLLLTLCCVVQGSTESSSQSSPSSPSSPSHRISGRGSSSGGIPRTTSTNGSFFTPVNIPGPHASELLGRFTAAAADLLSDIEAAHAHAQPQQKGAANFDFDFDSLVGLLYLLCLLCILRLLCLPTTR